MTNTTNPKARDYAGPCPRCDLPVPDPQHVGESPGALSRYDNETYICSPCGSEEAVMAGHLIPFDVGLYSDEADAIRRTERPVASHQGETTMTDRTNDMLLDQIVDMLDNEPPSDAGRHPSLAVHERVGSEWASWHERLSGARILLGHRLVNAAIDERKAQQGAERNATHYAKEASDD